jgi:hypothetical protein
MPRPATFPAIPADRHRAWWLPLPLLLAALAYARVLGAGLSPEALAATAAPAAQDLGAALRDLWPALLEGRSPLPPLAFALDRALGGPGPVAYHLGGLVLHLTVSTLAFLLARTLLRLAGAARPTGLAVAVAGLFALHPLHSQAVIGVAARGELLASGLYLATLLLLVASERRGPSLGGALALVSALLLFALGLSVGPLLLTLPVTWLLLAWAVPTDAARRILASWPRRLLVLLPFLAVEAACLVGAPGRFLGAEPMAGTALTPQAWFFTQWRVLPTYLRLVVWPAGLRAQWDLAPSPGPADAAVLSAGLAGFTLLLGAAALWRWARDRRLADHDGAAGRVVGFGVVWFYAVLAPTSILASRGALLFEPRVYLASLGVLLALGVAAERLLSRLYGVGPARRQAAVLLVAAAWGLLAMALYQRNRAWEASSEPPAVSAARAAAPARPTPRSRRNGWALAHSRGSAMDHAGLRSADPRPVAEGDDGGRAASETILHRDGRRDRINA